MLVQLSTLVLASQLFITVADNVPQYDIQRGCRADNANTSNLNVGLDESTKNCIKDEQTARDRLQSQWSQFSPSGRASCSRNENDVGGVPPSYVELLTCLQDQLAVKKLNN
jgi:hypothetical protein